MSFDEAQHVSDMGGCFAHKRGAEVLAPRVAPQEDYNARQEGADPRTRLH